MPKLGERKCPSCDEFSHPERDNWEWCNLSAREICYSCYESEDEHSSTVVRYSPYGEFEGEQTGGKEAVRFNDEYAFETECGEDPPAWFAEHFLPRTYVRTDGWRGYYETPVKGLVNVAKGWVTGYPDGSMPEKERLGELYEKLSTHPSYATSLPCPLYWLFEPTSNVFSTASEMYVETHDDLIRLGQWLSEHDFELEAVKAGFH